MEILINNWFIWPFSAKKSKEYRFKVLFFFKRSAHLYSAHTPTHYLVYDIYHASPCLGKVIVLLPKKKWTCWCSLLCWSLWTAASHLPSPHVSYAHFFSLPLLSLCKLIPEYLLFDNYMNRKRKESVPFEFRIIHSIGCESYSQLCAAVSSSFHHEKFFP